MSDASEVWSSCGKLGQCLWKLFSKRTCQEHSGHDDVNRDFEDPLKPSQSGQEDRRLPENAGTKRRSCVFVAAQFKKSQLHRSRGRVCVRMVMEVRDTFVSRVSATSR